MARAARIIYLILTLTLNCVIRTTISQEIEEIVTSKYLPDLDTGVLNKCSDNFEADIVDLPRSWVESLNISDNEATGNLNSSVQFSLVVSGINCEKNQSQLIKLDFNGKATSPEYFTYNGYFRNGTLYFPPGAHCIDNVTENELKIRVCTPNCKVDLCLPKCCPPGKVLVHNVQKQYFNPSTAKCEAVEDVWNPFLYRIVNGTPEIHEKSSRSDLPFYTIRTNLPIEEHCRIQGYTPHAKAPRRTSFDLLITENGKIYTRSKPEPQKGWQESTTISCIDGMWEISSSKSFVPIESNQVIWSCLAREGTFGQNIRMIINIIFYLMIFSALCLSITVVVYVLVWDKQKVHGWTITMFCFTIMADWAFFGAGLGIVLFKRSFINTAGCKIMGVCHHFFHLSSFSWMNVLTFDMWTTISSMTHVSQRSKGRRRFAVYCGYGFGVPGIIVAIAVAIQFLVSPSNYAIRRPEYGSLWCGIDSSSSFYYGSLITMVFFAINVVLKFLFFKSLRNMCKDSQRADQSSTKQKKCMGVLLMKLAIIMGASFTLNCIVLLLKGDAKNWFNLFAVFITFVRGVAIAWIFISDNKIKRQLQEKFRIVRAIVPPDARRNSTSGTLSARRASCQTSISISTSNNYA